MKPPRFTYHDPRTLPEALDLLRQLGADAKLLAGGQTLLPTMKQRPSRVGMVMTSIFYRS